MRLEQFVVPGRAVPRRMLEAADAGRPRGLAGHLARQAVGGLFEVVRRLHRQAASGRQLADQAGIQRFVVRHPLQRSVRQDHVIGLRRIPGGDVGQLEAQRGQALAGSLDHVVRIVHAGQFRVRIARGQHFGGIARAAAQVHGAFHFLVGQGGNQVPHRTGALVLESGILLGGPTGHGGSLRRGSPALYACPTHTTNPNPESPPYPLDMAGPGFTRPPVRAWRVPNASSTARTPRRLRSGRTSPRGTRRPAPCR